MSLDPRNTVFVFLSFEGPDIYSRAGGLGVRVGGLTRALAQQGYVTYLYFCGDPNLPGEEDLEDGRLRLRRWCQWISALHPAGVYDGEEGKLRDWNTSLPPSIVDSVVAPLAADGSTVVIMGEEWHTSWSMKLISDALHARGLRDRAVMLWNANNTFGFDRVDWGSLTYATTVTTVSRFMKLRMWERGLNPIVIPNGIPRESISEIDPATVSKVRSAVDADHFWFKVGRFDPDKRWLMAISAVAEMKARGGTVRLLMRGGREAHGAEVMALARRLNLEVRDAPAPHDVGELVALLRASAGADALNLTSFMSDAILPVVYASADAVLANSGQEPFGLVGLEVMAAGGLAVTGSTGEDYADAYRNSIVLETADPLEIVIELDNLKARPSLAASIRSRGRATAREYTWDRVIEQLLLRIEFAAATQGVRIPGEGAARQEPA